MSLNNTPDIQSIARVWSLYFPFDPFEAGSPWTEATKLFRRFFLETNEGRELMRGVNLDAIHQITFDYTKFVAILPEGLKGFTEVLHGNASTTLACLGLAICSLRRRVAPIHDRLAPRLRPIAPRFVNYRPLTRLSRLKADLIGKFVSIRGNVVKVCGVSPLVRRMDFTCTKCQAVISKDMPDGKFEPPTTCGSQGCRGKTFDPQRDTAVTVDFQRIRLQEMMEDDDGEEEEEEEENENDDNGSEGEQDERRHHGYYDGRDETSFWEGNGDSRDSTVSRGGGGGGGNRRRSEGGSSGATRRTRGGGGGGAMVEDGTEGRVPRTINVELTDDLVDCCVPGDVVIVSGIVKALNPESIEGRGSRAKGKGREAGLLLLLVEANSVQSPFAKSVASRGAITSTDEDGVVGRPGEGGGKDAAEAEMAEVAANRASGVGEKSDVVATLTPSDMRAIAKIARRGERQKLDVLARLVHSLCPSIYGHDEVKTGLLFGLLGGSNTSYNNNNSGSTTGGGNSDDPPEKTVSIRADVHVLVVGEPGMGKSQMLRAAGHVAPRGVYVCGNTTTSSGLTVTLSRDGKGSGGGGEYSLEAGALVLADCGVCCIDEFDKMTSQHAALLEAMEQQSISIAKAGVVCTLLARTAVLAAANPKGGTYNRDRTLFENLNLAAPLLSRFDLVFMMLDDPDERKDELLSAHVLRMHTSSSSAGGGGSSSTRRRRRSRTVAREGGNLTTRGRGRDLSRGGNNVSQYVSTGSQAIEEYASRPFRQRITEAVMRIYGGGDDANGVEEDEEEEPIPPAMLRKYIAYARHYVHPKLTAAACRRIQRFYLELRQKGKASESTPITTRQLESLVRLVQARARAELRTVATEEDAVDVVSLVEESLLDALTDEAGRVDLSRSGGMSQSKLQKAFVDHLKRACTRRMSPFFTTEELAAEARGIGAFTQITDFQAFLERLSDHCYILKKPNGYVVSRAVHGMSQF